MSRNRMRNSQSLHWMGVVKWVLIAGMLAGLGFCYMLCKNQNLHLADEDLKLQRQLNQIETRNTELALDLESMKSMARPAAAAEGHAFLAGLLERSTRDLGPAGPEYARAPGSDGYGAQSRFNNIEATAGGVHQPLQRQQ